MKRLANESYRDARHAPKPTDIIKQWSEAEIEKCFEDTEKVVMGYFATLFPERAAEDATKPKLKRARRRLTLCDRYPGSKIPLWAGRLTSR